MTIEKPHHPREKSVAPVRPGGSFVLPFAAIRVHRIEIRVILNQTFDLFLSEPNCILEQFSIGVVDELNHKYLRS